MNELIKLSLKEKIRIYEISTKQDYIKIEKLQDELKILNNVIIPLKERIKLYETSVKQDNDKMEILRNELANTKKDKMKTLMNNIITNKIL
jgi:hypothetical protein